MLQNAIHIWITNIDEIDDPYLLDIYRAQLSKDEMSRYERFRFDKDKKQFLVSHALVRSVLSSYVEIAPKDLQFICCENGKPKVASEEGELLPLEFNLSHSGRYAAIVVTNEIECGIDIEEVDPKRSIMDIAEEYFSASEMLDLRSIVDAEQIKRFYTYWTLKESYIKAKGATIAQELNRVSFDLHHQNQIQLKVNDVTGADVKGWQFNTQQISEGYVLSVALQHEFEYDIKIETFKTTPMQVFG